MIAKHNISQIIIVMASALVITCGISAEDNQNKLNVVPDLIQIGAFYHGTRVTVTADVVFCDEAVVVLEGDNRKVTLHRKGRVGFIWMNVAQITMEGIPQVYIMAASDSLDLICDRKTRDVLGLGLESLRPQMKIESTKPLTGQEFDQFIKLKSHEGTYDTNNKANLESIVPGRSEVIATLPIPSTIPPGDYAIRVYCFRQGVPIEEKSADFKIERVGLSDLMINLATRNPAAYGLIAIIIAMAVGIIMGFVFSSFFGEEH